MSPRPLQRGRSANQKFAQVFYTFNLFILYFYTSNVKYFHTSLLKAGKFKISSPQHSLNIEVWLETETQCS